MPSQALLIYFFVALAFIAFFVRKINRQLSQSWLIALIRCAVQLSLLGLILGTILKIQSLLLLSLVFTILTITASWITIERIKKKASIYLEVFVSLGIGTVLFGVCVFFVSSQDLPFTAQYIFPFLGVLLSNSISGVSLCLKSLYQFLDFKKEEIEGFLTLGLRPREVLKIYLGDLMDLALTPSMNSMAAAGIVGVPGVMAGALMSGQSVSSSIQTQIHIFITLSLSVFFSSLLCLALVLKRQKLFSGEQRQLKLIDIQLKSSELSEQI